MQWKFCIVGICCLTSIFIDSLRSRRLDCFKTFIFRIKYFIDITFEFFFFRLNVFNCKRNNSSTNLHSHCVKSFKSQFVFQKNDCSKFTSVVFNVKSVLFALNNSVTSTDTYIIDSNLTLMSSSEFKFTLLIRNCKQMNISRSVFIKWHGLKQNIIRVSARCYFINQIYNFVNFLANFESVWVHLLADFAFESLPIEGSDILVSCTRRFLLFLSKDPIL